MEEIVIEDLDELRALPDPMDRAKRAGTMQDRLQMIGKEVSRVRREAIEELLRGGMTQTQLAKDLGMSRGRISQLMSGGPPPERAFFGDDTLTVALGGKLEAEKVKPGPVLAQEDFVAFHRLKELLQTLQLDAGHEIVQPPGFLRLNRSNLVVICGPRLSPILGEVLESDPILGFRNDGDEWYLVDQATNTEYRSPMENGEAGDVCYFGRLPRPDGKGYFTYMAGIHAPGPIGVIHYLTSHLGELYREVKGRRFSTLVQCEFDPKTYEVTSSRKLTPIYIHEGR
jgi:transcriptional regulator with XRE-family HTH domain